MTRPGDPATRSACAWGERRAGAHGLAVGGVSRYKWVYRDRRGRPSVTTQRSRGCDMAQGRCDTHGSAPHRARQEPMLRYKVCIVTGGEAVALRHDAHTPRHSRCTPTTWPRYGPARATTGCCARGRDAVCVQAGSGCAHCMPDSVLTQCTILSHCLGLCS